jgi:hypothetical protein
MSDPVVEAIAALLLLQAPPVVVSDKVTDDPEHTDDGPVIAAGERLTVTVTEVLHPPVNV